MCKKCTLPSYLSSWYACSTLFTPATGKTSSGCVALWQFRPTSPLKPAGRSLGVSLTMHHGECSYPHGHWAAAVVHRLAQHTVSGQPGRGCELRKTEVSVMSAWIWCCQHPVTFSFLFLLCLLAGSSEISSWCADSLSACARRGASVPLCLQ